ncbi:hypothetical protein HELRODRAFT_177700 [Helobdella robusta]|uniref:C-type lectin domain-containing protein n=1 Tax=Helobdella robusta TaxID=6412 RepID=T1FC36_HELRO|nr:hypothetical protein HELRODRAFT_177700 [Helobdella robusta]ESN97645.1 hypothetical protein HELRODRAFT_177700 [Helobdella robusta]
MRLYEGLIALSCFNLLVCLATATVEDDDDMFASILKLNPQLNASKNCHGLIHFLKNNWLIKSGKDYDKALSSLNEHFTKITKKVKSNFEAITNSKYGYRYMLGEESDKGICSQIHCWNGEKCVTGIKYEAFEGTSCGNKKWCDNKECFNDENAPENKIILKREKLCSSDKCLFGDYDETMEMFGVKSIAMMSLKFREIHPSNQFKLKRISSDLLVGNAKNGACFDEFVSGVVKLKADSHLQCVNKCLQFGIDTFLIDCPPEFDYIPKYNKCYSFRGKGMTWNESRTLCNTVFNFHSVICDDPNEKLAIASLRASGSTYAWEPYIGERSAMKYSFWLDDYPKYPRSGFDCIQALYPSYDWFNWDCSSSDSVLCEIDMF